LVFFRDRERERAPILWNLGSSGELLQRILLYCSRREERVLLLSIWIL